MAPSASEPSGLTPEADISDRRRSEEAIQAERTRHAHVLRHARAFIVVLRGPDLVVELANDRARDVTGGRLRAGRPLREAMPELEAQGFLRRLQHVRDRGAGQVDHRRPLRVQDADGRVRELFVDFVCQPLPLPDGEPAEVLVYGMDVTEQVLAERERAELLAATQHAVETLRRSEARFRAVMDRAADLVAILDVRGVVQYASPSYASGLGYDPAELQDATAFDLVHPDDLPGVLAAFDRVSRDPGGTTTLEFRARHADGRWRTVAAAATNLFEDPAVGGLVVRGHDVTDQRQMEMRLRQAQKMEAVAKLAGGVAHDFNNLLTVIRANAEFLALETSGQPRDDVEEIRKAAARAASLTRQLLAFSRQQVLEPRVVDPNVVIAGLQRMLARLLGDDIECTVGLERRVGTVLVDPSQLEQILLTLAVNARDAMPLGGELRIETTRGPLPESIRSARPDLPARAWVCLAVRDTGSGMTPETLARVFEPFFTTKAMGKGTGLGLATVHGIVEQSGGVIEVHSTPGNGSTFSLYFPASDEDAPADLALAGPPARAPRAGTILLVEDDDAVRAVALRMLTAAGLTVVVARTGAEALLRLTEPEAAFDVLLSDAVTPHLGGTELLRAAVSVHPGIVAVLMSGYTDAELVRRGGTRDRAVLLQKPFTREGLLGAVDEALELARTAGGQAPAAGRPRGRRPG